MFSDRKFLTIRFSHWGALILAAAACSAPFFFHGIPNGNDLPQHYQFALTFYENLRNGNFYPVWSDASNNGFGDVGIRFYPPLAYYVLVLFRALAGNWFEASALAFGFWFFLSGVGVYLWAREWFGEKASLAGAVVYVFAPYHVNQIYNAFTYAEFAAAAVLPFCFLFVTRVLRRGNMTSVFGLAAAYALLVLTHLPMTVIGSLALAVYALAGLRKKDFFAAGAKLSFAVLAGLAASAFYWVRMVSELNFVRHATEEFTSQSYDFRFNFLAAFLYVTPEVYDDRSLWFSDLMLLATLGLFVPGALIFYSCAKKVERSKLFGVLALIAFAIFISTPLSLFVWENFGFLQKVQFPWRWLAVISMAGAIFAAAGFQHYGQVFRGRLRPLGLISAGFILAGVVFTATQVVKPAIYISRADFAALVGGLRDAPSYDCWLPIWSDKAATASAEWVSIENREVEITEWKAAEKAFRVAGGDTGNARIAVFYYPHWQATVNGEKALIERDDHGAMLIALPERSADVRIFFREPDFVRTANILSITVWLLFAAIIIFLSKNRKYE